MEKKTNNKKVLIIEDEAMLSEMYSDFFSYEGFEVFVADDGEKGIKKAFLKKPDIIILDVLLPKKEGTEVLKEIREDEEWGKNVPIIMLTNLDSSDHILTVIQKYKPSYYFIKTSIEPKEVLMKAKNLLDL